MLVRTKLIATITKHEGPVLIEAGAGSGKTALLDQLTADDPTRWSRVDGGSAEAVHALTTLPADHGLAVDNVHLLDEPSLDSLLRLVSREGPVVIAGRDLPARLVSETRSMQPLAFDAADLFFNREELVDLTGDESIAASVERLTAGWPLAVTAILERVGAGPEAGARISRQTSQIDVLLDRLLSAGGHDWVPLGQLSFCADFSSVMANKLEPRLLERLKRAGVPTFRQAPDRYQIPLPVRQALRRLTDLPNEDLEPLLKALLSEGAFETALDVCAQRGWIDRAASLLAELNPDELYSFDHDQLPALLTILGSDIRSHPRAMLSIARIQFIAGDIDDVRRSLHVALDTVSANDPEIADALHHELLAELAFLEFESSNFDLAAEYCDRCVSVIDPSGRGAANARLNETLAGLLANAKTRDKLLEARDLLVDSTNIWNQLGFVTRAGLTLRMMVWVVLFELGHFAEALILLDRALNSGGTTAAETAMNHLFRARALGCLGQPQAARVSLDEAERLVVGLDLAWVQGFAAWIDSVNASYDADSERVVASVQRAEQLLGELTTGSTGGVFRSDAAISLARCDQQEAARAQLTELQRLEGIDATDLAKATAAVEIHLGDPEAGLKAIVEWQESGPLSPLSEMIADIWRAAGSARFGRHQDAQDFLASARAKATVMGDADLVGHIEGRLVDAVVDHLAKASDAEVAGHHIQLFGTFKIERGGIECRLTKGHGQTVVKLLVIGNGRLHVDEVIDALWPTADANLGRRRLRNVLQRIRTACGPLVHRDDDFLSLDVSADSDLARTSRAIDRLAKASEPPLAELADLAATMTAEFLEGERFEPWAEAPRSTMEQNRLRVLDQLVEVTVESGDMDRAAAVAFDAIELDPFAQERIDRVAAWFGNNDRPDLVEQLERHTIAARQA